MPEYITLGGKEYELGPMVAIQGKDGCRDPRCTRLSMDSCVGYHCPHCGEPCGMMGHRDCPALDPRVVV